MFNQSASLGLFKVKLFIEGMPPSCYLLTHNTLKIIPTVLDHLNIASEE